MLTLTVNTLIKAPIEHVYLYVATAKHWPEWHPASVGVRGEIDRPLQPGVHIIEQTRFNDTVCECAWTVVDLVPLKRIVLVLAETPLGTLKSTYAFEAGVRDVWFTHSLLLADIPPEIGDDTLQHYERELEATSIQALATVKRTLEAAA